MEASKDKNDRTNLRKQRNCILRKIHQALQKEKDDMINERIEEIERYKDVSNRMFQVIKQLQPKDKKKILVNSENGLTSNETEQVDIITKHFRDVFYKTEEEKISEVKPTEMTKPFTKK